MPRQVPVAWAVAKELLAQNVPVHFEPGWTERGSVTFSPRGLVVHHTADGPGEYPSLRIVRDGRSGLPGPLAQWGLGRSGTVYLIAAGRANHAGRGGWRGLSGNSTVWGIEAESTGRGDWTDAQRRNYPKLAAALARHTPFSVDMICAHREWTPRKPDPAGIDMPSFRVEVARLLSGGPIEEDEDMMKLFTVAPGERHNYWLEPCDPDGAGFLGTKRGLIVVSQHGFKSVPAEIWVDPAGGGPGKLTLAQGKPFVRHLDGTRPGYLYVANLGDEPLAGSIMFQR